MSAAEKRQNGCTQRRRKIFFTAKQLNLPHAHSFTLRQAAVSTRASLYKAEKTNALALSAAAAG
jgi:hypothetical protein